MVNMGSDNQVGSQQAKACHQEARSRPGKGLDEQIRASIDHAAVSPPPSPSSRAVQAGGTLKDRSKRWRVASHALARQASSRRSRRRSRITTSFSRAAATSAARAASSGGRSELRRSRADLTASRGRATAAGKAR